jgi:hypothetical protein
MEGSEQDVAAATRERELTMGSGSIIRYLSASQLFDPVGESIVRGGQSASLLKLHEFVTRGSITRKLT